MVLAGGVIGFCDFLFCLDCPPPMQMRFDAGHWLLHVDVHLVQQLCSSVLEQVNRQLLSERKPARCM